MLTSFIRIFSIIAMMTVAMIGSAQAEMTKGEIEKIVHDYLMNNGEVILQAVDNYQQQSIQERYKDAVKNNEGALFNNERSPFAGPADADVVLVEFFDYNCGYCKRAFNDVKALGEQDKNLKIIFKEFPILSPSSEDAAKWALAAQKQNKFFEMHEALMTHRGKLDNDTLVSIAKEVGLNVEQAQKDIQDAKIMVEIEKNKALATEMGISGTPAFVIGNEVIPGAVPIDMLKEKISALRAAKKK